MCKREANSNYLYAKVNCFNLMLNFYSFKVKPRLNRTNKISTIFFNFKAKQKSLISTYRTLSIDDCQLIGEKGGSNWWLNQNLRYKENMWFYILQKNRVSLKICQKMVFLKLWWCCSKITYLLRKNKKGSKLLLTSLM